MTQTTLPNPLTGLNGKFGTILIDPPWRFQNRTGKMAPEHKRLKRYETMSTESLSHKGCGLRRMGHENPILSQ